MTSTVSVHDCHQGFCTVCGSVWATRTSPRQSPPIPRAAALSR